MTVNDLTDKQWTLIESYMRAELQSLCQEWGIPDWQVQAIFRNKRQSSCRELWHEDGKYYRHRYTNVDYPERNRAACLRFGWWDAGDTFCNTMLEYQQCKHLLKGNPTGVEALGYLVRHEFAHALIWVLGEADHEKPHGPTFVETYRQLLEGWDLWKDEVYV